MTAPEDPVPPEKNEPEHGSPAAGETEDFTPFGARFDEDFSGAPRLDPTLADIDATVPLDGDEPGPEPTLHLDSDPPSGPAADFPVIPGVTLKSLIGKGGQGQVYRGNQSYVDREVAVKVLASGADSSFSDRFRREAKLLAGMQHPFVVACYNAGVTDAGHGFITMEFIDGPDLAAHLRDRGPMAPCDALGLVRDVARALEYALDAGVIHRDVKPQNVLLQPKDSVDPEGFAYRPKLADLGLARAAGESSVASMLTAPGSVMGTPATMALEQIDDPDSVDFRADIYGLGCVLYHCLAGKSAYRGLRPSQVFKKKAQEPAPNLRDDAPDVPPRLAKFVAHLMEAERDKRPQSYAELIEKIEAEMTALDGVAVCATEPAEGKGPVRKLAPLVAGAAVLALGALWVSGSGGDEPDQGSEPVRALGSGADGSEPGRAAPEVLVGGDETGEGTPQDPTQGGDGGPDPDSSAGTELSGSEPSAPVVVLEPAIPPGTEQLLFGSWRTMEDLLEGWRKEPPDVWAGLSGEFEVPMAVYEGEARATRSLPSGAWRLSGEVRVRRPFQAPDDSVVRGGVALGFAGGQEVSFSLVLGADPQNGDLQWRSQAASGSEADGLEEVGPKTFPKREWVPFCIEYEGSELRLGASPDSLQAFDAALLGGGGPPVHLTLVGQGIISWRNFALVGL